MAGVAPVLRYSLVTPMLLVRQAGGSDYCRLPTWNVYVLVSFGSSIVGHLGGGILLSQVMDLSGAGASGGEPEVFFANKTLHRTLF